MKPKSLFNFPKEIKRRKLDSKSASDLAVVNNWENKKNNISNPPVDTGVKFKLDDHPNNNNAVSNLVQPKGLENTNLLVAKNIYNFVEKDMHVPLYQYQDLQEKDYVFDTEGGTSHYIINQRYLTAK